MRVLMLNTQDRQGGATRSARRLTEGLARIGTEAQMLVQERTDDDRRVHGPRGKLGQALAMLRPTLDRLPLALYRRERATLFSPAWLPERRAARIRRLAPDIVHLHWLGGGFVRIETLASLGVPMVWTLHDMWAFTGGCHYDGDCGRYRSHCARCPVLRSRHGHDLAHWVLSRKRRAWTGLDLTIVAPSGWLADCARGSALLRGFRTVVIPYGLDTSIYRPVDKHTARSLLGIPPGRRLILFGAVNATSDPRKGFAQLQEAVGRLAGRGWRDRASLLVFGGSPPQTAAEPGLPTRYLGRLQDDLSLSIIYSAADVFVAPSLQENLSNTVMESLACGTPCVAFAIGGMPDMISHRANGYLARPHDADDLAAGIEWVLDDPERAAALCANARATVEDNYTLEHTARRYRALYEEILARPESRTGARS